MMVDLHLHTTASDGSDNPDELLEKVRTAGITYFSVTDHDSTASSRRVKNLLSWMQANGVPDLPSFINGIEFSCEDEKGKYHILGYAYNYDWGNILRLTRETHALRMIKLDKRLKYIRDTYGFKFPDEDLASLHQLDNPGKPHIANLMVKFGYAMNRSEAIKKYLNAYSPPEGHIRPEQAIRAILADGGIPVLAHPIYGDGDQLIMGPELGERIERLKTFGLKGLECFYSGFVSKQRHLMLSLAEEYDMYVTAGSDYHGSNKLIPLGDTGLEEEGGSNPRLEAFLEKALQ